MGQESWHSTAGPSNLGFLRRLQWGWTAEVRVSFQGLGKAVWCVQAHIVVGKFQFLQTDEIRVVIILFI